MPRKKAKAAKAKSAKKAARRTIRRHPAPRAAVKPAKVDVSASSVIAGVVLSHPDKVLFPEQNLTKEDLAAYYEQIAPWMLAHVAGRPISLVRCPAGEGKACFFQRHAGAGNAKAIRQFKIAGKVTDRLSSPSIMSRG